MLFETQSVSISLIVLNVCFGFITCYFVPPCYQINTKKVAGIPPYTNVGSLISELDDLWPQNGFYMHELVFERAHEHVPLHAPMKYLANIQYSRISDKDDDEQLAGTIIPVTPTRKSAQTGTYRVYLNEQISHRQSSIQVIVINVSSNVKSISLITTVQNRAYNFFTVLHRTFFFLLISLNIRSFFKVRINRFCFIHLVLFGLMLFALNPSVIIHFSHPSQYIICFNEIARALFESYFRIYLLLCLSNFRKNSDTEAYNSSVLPCLIFFIIMFFAKVAHYTNSDLKFTTYRQTVLSKASPILAFELGIDMTYYTWFIVSFLSTLSKRRLNNSDLSYQSFIYSIIASVSIWLLGHFIASKFDYSKAAINLDALDWIIYWIFAYLILQFALTHVNNNSTSFFDTPNLNQLDNLPQFAMV